MVRFSWTCHLGAYFSVFFHSQLQPPSFVSKASQLDLAMLDQQVSAWTCPKPCSDRTRHCDLIDFYIFHPSCLVVFRYVLRHAPTFWTSQSLILWNIMEYCLCFCSPFDPIFWVCLLFVVLSMLEAAAKMVETRSGGCGHSEGHALICQKQGDFSALFGGTGSKRFKCLEMIIGSWDLLRASFKSAASCPGKWWVWACFFWLDISYSKPQKDRQVFPQWFHDVFLIISRCPRDLRGIFFGACSICRHISNHP